MIQDRFKGEFQEAVMGRVAEDECVSSLRALAADRAARKERVNALPKALRDEKCYELELFVDGKQDWSLRNSYGRSLEEFVQRYAERKQGVLELISHFNLDVRVDDYEVEKNLPWLQ